MSETKVQPTHLRRAAVVYVRQSTVALGGIRDLTPYLTPYGADAGAILGGHPNPAIGGRLKTGHFR